MSADWLEHPETSGEDSGAERPSPAAEPRSRMPRIVAPEAAPLVPRGGVFEGEVSIRGETRIDGGIAGRLRGSGRLVLGPEAWVEGRVECDVLESQGTIRGPVVARERVRLGPGARVDGDLETPLLEVAESAVWNGLARVGRSRPGAPGSD